MENGYYDDLAFSRLNFIDNDIRQAFHYQLKRTWISAFMPKERELAK